MITIKDLTVSYQDTLALEPLSLTIKEPTITGIIGPNGAGKSTLLKGMLGIIDHQGQTLLDQKPLQNSLQRVAYVEQKINIDYHFPIKVKECVSLGLYPQLKLFQGLKSSHWNKVAEALKIVGLEEADCIFLDEPFVGIDSVSEEIIMSTLRSLKAAGKIILIVHHDLSKVVDYFDQVILLNRKLIAFGPTETSFTKDNMKKTYGSQLFMNGGD